MPVGAKGFVVDQKDDVPRAFLADFQARSEEVDNRHRAQREQRVADDRRSAAYYVERNTCSLIATVLLVLGLACTAIWFAAAVDHVAREVRTHVEFAEKVEQHGIELDHDGFHEALRVAKKSTHQSIVIGALYHMAAHNPLAERLGLYENAFFEGLDDALRQNSNLFWVAIAAVLVAGIVLAIGIRAVLDPRLWRGERPKIK
jgi:hypothetical protein